MEASVVHKQSKETGTKSSGKPFFARSAENSFFSDNQKATPFFSGIQTKLTVGQPGDQYEQEADAVADQVMRMQDTTISPLERSKVAPQPKPILRLQPEEEDRVQMKLVQKKCDQCEKEELQPKLLQRQPEEEEELLQAKLNQDPLKRERNSILQNNAPAGAAASFEGQLSGNRGGGEQLDSHARQFMETRFNADFSQIRVHRDSQAIQMNQQINAQAFAYGHDVYFNQDRYNPGTSNGKHLLAHELTHTIQQGAAKLLTETERGEHGSLAEQNVDGTLTKPNATSGETNEVTGPLPATPSDTKEATAESSQDQINLSEPAVAQKPSAGATIPAGKDTENALLPQADEEISAKEAGGLPGQAADKTVTDTAIPKVSLQGQSSAGLLSQVSAFSPVSFVQNASQFRIAIPQIQSEEKSSLANSFPEIPGPTGLPVHERPTVPRTDLSGGTSSELGAEGEQEGEHIAIEHAQSKGEYAIANTPTPRTQGEDDPNFVQNVQSSLAQLPVSDPTVNTSAGLRPPVDTSGAANPVQNQQNQLIAGQDISQGLVQGQQASQQDFGQDNIYPYLATERLNPQTTPATPPPYVGHELEALPELPVEGYTYFNEQTQSQYQASVDEQTAQYEARRAAWEVASAQEKQQGEQAIEAETQHTRAEQEAIQAQAKGEVMGYRQQWQAENEQLRTDFELQTTTRKGEVDGQITTEIQGTNQAVETELSQAEQQAETEKAKTEREAQRKRDEGQNREPSFWERAANAISDFFESIRNAINKLFNDLRRWVADLIERAKAAVNRLIDAARQKIIGWIEDFGNFLKGIVNRVLSAFPEIAERFNNLIDQGINWAVERVNQLAEALKSIASSILDALGAALDFLLSGLQSVLNSILNVLESLAQFFLNVLHELAEVIRNLINRWGGGRFRIEPDGTLVININDITLFDNIEKQYPEEPQPVMLFIPLVEGAGAIGPIPVAGALGIQLWGTLQGVLALGPGLIRSIEIRLNPFKSEYSGRGQLYVAAAAGPRLTLFGGPAGIGGALIPVTPPIFVALSLEAGLRATGTGWGIGALQTTVILAYIRGDISFEMLNEIMLGILLQGDLDFSAALRVYGAKGGGKALCQYIYPLGHWEWGKAYKISIPLEVGRSGGKYYFDFGPVTGAPMPVEDIVTAITALNDAGLDCMSWKEIFEYLCEIGIIPETFCPEKDDNKTKALPPAAASCAPVNPSGSPTVNKPGPDNSCTPSPSGTKLNWTVVSIDADNWGVCVNGLILDGVINIRPWPSKPNTMTVPNTPNPVDGGNIEDKTGSKNHWQFAIDDLADYDSASGGGAGEFWHSTVASEAHEWAHWNADYKGDAVVSKSGGNWPKVNTDLNALQESKASSPSAIDARKKLEPRVESIMNTWRGDTVRRWNKIIKSTDQPGNGGKGYAAGMQVLNGLIRKIRDYAKRKGWISATTLGGKPNRVRFQLQHHTNHKDSEPIERDRSITVEEGKAGVDRMMSRAEKNVNEVCKKAQNQMKSTLEGYPPQGVDSKGNVARKICDKHRDDQGDKKKFRHRIDFENLAGKNFTS